MRKGTRSDYEGKNKKVLAYMGVKIGQMVKISGPCTSTESEELGLIGNVQICIDNH